MRFIQWVLELLSHGTETGDLRATQDAIEYGKPAPPAAEIRDTQNAIEWLRHPPVDVWYTQGVIEVAWPMPGPPQPPEPPGEPAPGGNDCMLILDLSQARETLPDYEPATMPEY